MEKSIQSILSFLQGSVTSNVRRLVICHILNLRKHVFVTSSLMTNLIMTNILINIVTNLISM